MVRRVLRLLLVSLIAASATSHLVRISLESDDHLRFTGSIHVGSPPRSVRVVFDTGSSDTWVIGGVVDHADDGRASFYLRYGGGVVSGFATRTTFRLGRELRSDATELLLRHVPVGVVDSRQTAEIPGLEAQGVVGLGMGALAQIPGSSSLLGLLEKQHGVVGPVVFSFYIGSWSGAQPASQFIIGEDPALTSANTTWFSFPVLPHDALRALQRSSPTAGDNFGFWALRVRSVSFGNVLLPLRPSGPVALLDSGTSLLLLPQHAFDAAVQDLFDRFGKRLLTPPNKQRISPSCRPCHVHEFPPLVFEFLMDDGNESKVTSQRLELQGSDYVRCDPRRQECTAMIDAIDSSEISDHVDIVVLGTVFFRAYYARFDFTNRKVNIACTSVVRGACLGGLQPALDYRGKPRQSSLSDTPQPMRSLVGTCAAVTVLFLFTGFRLLL